MNKLALFTLLIILFSSCNSGKTGPEQRLRSENFELRQQRDSLQNLLNRYNKVQDADTLSRLPEPKSPAGGDGFSGKHRLTLQWISWDEPGSVLIVPAQNGWYTISGQQARGENYVKINGRIKPINKLELEFDGEIETRLENINNGEPCLKTGKQLFKATGDRQYWRLQDMASCEGGNTVDYVDIYF